MELLLRSVVVLLAYFVVPVSSTIDNRAALLSMVAPHPSCFAYHCEARIPGTEIDDNIAP